MKENYAYLKAQGKLFAAWKQISEVQVLSTVPRAGEESLCQTDKVSIWETESPLNSHETFAHILSGKFYITCEENFILFFFFFVWFLVTATLFFGEPKL